MLAAIVGLVAAPASHALSSADLATARQQVVERINYYRAQNGLAALTLDSRLNSSAQYHSDWMVSHNCFAHNCPGEPDVATRISNAGYPCCWTNENVAGGYDTAVGVVDAWFDETPPNDGHRRAILNADAHGVGVGWNGGCADYCNVWTADFGTVSDNVVGGAVALVPPTSLVTVSGSTTILADTLNTAPGRINFFTWIGAPADAGTALRELQKLAPALAGLRSVLWASINGQFVGFCASCPSFAQGPNFPLRTNQPLILVN